MTDGFSGSQMIFIFLAIPAVSHYMFCLGVTRIPSLAMGITIC